VVRARVGECPLKCTVYVSAGTLQSQSHMCALSIEKYASNGSECLTKIGTNSVHILMCLFLAAEFRELQDCEYYNARRL
jgi:hypothetical protein